MKKTLKFLLLILGLVFSVTAMTACSDDDEGGLSGVYVYEPTPDWGAVYHFVNGNTVHYYSSAHKGYSTNINGGFVATKQIGSSNWYADAADGHSTYTYEVDDNKVIIPMKGTIMTISGNRLIEDGGPTFTKD